MPGYVLRTLRLAAGVRQNDVAELLGVTKQAVTQLESRARVRETSARRYLTRLALLAALRS